MSGYGPIDWNALPAESQWGLIQQFALSIAQPTPAGKLNAFLGFALGACGFAMPGLVWGAPLDEQDPEALEVCNRMIGECTDAVLGVLAAHDVLLQEGL